ncbi:MAG: DUF599 family protein [Rhodospirillaceae bacterium]
MSYILDLLPWPDLIAVLCLPAFWAGYSMIADTVGRSHRELAQVMDGYRLDWMRRMLARDNRMADVNIIIAHHRSGALFASTTILILAGIVAVLGNVDRLLVMIDQFSFATLASKELIEVKVVAMLLIFVYGFFKFAWGLRQYNNALVMIGAASLPPDCDADVTERYAAKTARVLTRANATFIRGMWAYYFGLATLTWFLHPYLFIAAVLLVVAVLYRRDFHSVTVKAMMG